MQFLTLFAIAIANSGGLGPREADGQRPQSIQLEPALQAAAARRAAAEQATVLGVLQRALREYLRAHENDR